MYNKEEWQKVCKFHGHECPGVAIGFKACQALSEMGYINNSKDEEIVCVTENDACGVDAIQCLLSCTFGKGNLIYKANGKMAYNFYFRETGEDVRLYLKVDDKKENMTREEWKKYILNASTNELFKISKPTIILPEKARIFNSIKCENCGELVREDKIRFQNGKKVCLDCFKEYNR